MYGCVYMSICVYMVFVYGSAFKKHTLIYQIQFTFTDTFLGQYTCCLSFTICIAFRIRGAKLVGPLILIVGVTTVYA